MGFEGSFEIFEHIGTKASVCCNPLDHGIEVTHVRPPNRCTEPAAESMLGLQYVSNTIVLPLPHRTCAFYSAPCSSRKNCNRHVFSQGTHTERSSSMAERYAECADSW